jgi:hypothetical protein
MVSTEDVETGDAPPSYGSLFPDKMKPNNIAGRLRRGMSVSQSDGRGDDEESSGCTALCSCLTYLGCGLVVLAITVGLPITMITIGAINLDNCEIERYIPIWLIVMGVFQMIETSFRSCYHGSRSDDDDNQASKDPLACFLFAWFIAGNVWVFSNWKDYSPEKTIMNETNPHYCDDLTMKFSFGIIMTSYSLVAALILCGICFCCCVKD